MSQMPKTEPANLFARLEMAGLNLFPSKPVVSKLTSPLVSFSFDDFPKSAATIGAEIMEESHILATYYLTGSNCQSCFENVEQYDGDDVLRLYKAGHEIACHSYAHPRLRGRTKEEIAVDLANNLSFARALIGQDFQFQSFAYPYGEFDASSRGLMGDSFETARGVYRGVNKATIDFANLRTVPLELRRFNAAYLRSHIDDAIKNNGWIIFFTHDVADNCTNYGSTPKILFDTIQEVKSAGIEVLTVRDAARKIMAAHLPTVSTS